MLFVRPVYVTGSNVKNAFYITFSFHSSCTFLHFLSIWSFVLINKNLAAGRFDSCVCVFLSSSATSKDIFAPCSASELSFVYWHRTYYFPIDRHAVCYSFNFSMCLALVAFLNPNLCYSHSVIFFSFVVF